MTKWVLVVAARIKPHYLKARVRADGPRRKVCSLGGHFVVCRVDAEGPRGISSEKSRTCSPWKKCREPVPAVHRKERRYQ